MNVLVTGGAGYIGSHTVAELMRSKQVPVVYDNLAKGHEQAVPAGVPLIVGDIRDKNLLSVTITKYKIDAVVHFAASSLVGESMQKPRDYYNNNVGGTLSLLETMLDTGVDKIVFLVHGSCLRRTGSLAYHRANADNAYQCIWPDKAGH